MDFLSAPALAHFGALPYFLDPIKLMRMPTRHEQIIGLIDQFAAETDHRKQTEILHQLRQLLLDEREQRKSESAKASG